MMNNKSNKEVVENLKAQLKCVQSDIFSALKRYINVFSFDPVLKEIIKQPYYKVNKNKYTQGLDGKRNYGVIEDYNPNKRNDIVAAIKARLADAKKTDTSQKVVDMAVIVLHYETAASCIENTTLVPALKNNLENLRFAYVHILERENKFTPKCLN